MRCDPAGLLLLQTRARARVGPSFEGGREHGALDRQPAIETVGVVGSGGGRGRGVVGWWGTRVGCQ